MNINENSIVFIREDNKKEIKRRESIQHEDELQVMVNHPLYHKGAAFLESLHSYNVVLILTGCEALFILGDIFISVFQSAKTSAGVHVSHDSKMIFLILGSDPLIFVEKCLFWGSFFLLSVFAIEHILKLIIYGIQYLIKNTWMLIDIVMVAISLWLALGYVIIYLIFLEFWRWV
jgi:hypothetical protein